MDQQLGSIVRARESGLLPRERASCRSKTSTARSSSTCASPSDPQNRSRPASSSISERATAPLLNTRKDGRFAPPPGAASMRRWSRHLGGCCSARSVGAPRSSSAGSSAFDDVLASFPVAEHERPGGFDFGDGNLGAEILKRFNVTFDYAASRMVLEKSQRFADPFEREMSGLAFDFEQDGTLAVQTVLPGSPAAAAGIAEGDRILSIDGQTGALGENGVRKALTIDGVEVRLSVRRGGNVREEDPTEAAGPMGRAKRDRSLSQSRVASGHLEKHGACTPYAVRRTFLDSPSSHWSGSAGRGAPGARAAREVRLVKSVRAPRGGRRARRYSLTAAGRRRFFAWLEPPLPSRRPVRAAASAAHAHELPRRALAGEACQVHLDLDRGAARLSRDARPAAGRRRGRAPRTTLHNTRRARGSRGSSDCRRSPESRPGFELERVELGFRPAPREIAPECGETATKIAGSSTRSRHSTQAIPIPSAAHCTHQRPCHVIRLMTTSRSRMNGAVTRNRACAQRFEHGRLTSKGAGSSATRNERDDRCAYLRAKTRIDPRASVLEEKRRRPRAPKLSQLGSARAGVGLLDANDVGRASCSSSSSPCSYGSDPSDR